MTILTWKVGDEEVTFDTSKVAGELHAYAAVHGWKQRIGDAAALGRGSTAKEKAEAMRRLIDYYESGAGEWNMPREGGGRDADVLVAYAELKGVDVATARAKAEGQAKAQGVEVKKILQAWAGVGAIAQKVGEIKARRAGVDTKSLEMELGL